MSVAVVVLLISVVVLLMSVVVVVSCSGWQMVLACWSSLWWLLLRMRSARSHSEQSVRIPIDGSSPHGILCTLRYIR